jgi:predicted RNase H-like nuclease
MTVSADKLIKINRMTVANVDGTNAADVTVYIDTSVQTSSGATVASGAADVYIANTISVPADSTLVLVDTPIYLREGDILKGGASAASDLDLYISFEVLDDA